VLRFPVERILDMFRERCLRVSQSAMKVISGKTLLHLYFLSSKVKR
jgi:hypothetical protein